jgi:hypothetical protein
VLTDRGTELPIATVVALPFAHSTWATRQRAAFVGWLAAQWQFMRPRVAPSLVALVGMFAVLGSMRALTPDPPMPRAQHRNVWHVRAGAMWTCSSELPPADAGAVTIGRNASCVRMPTPTP